MRANDLTGGDLERFLKVLDQELKILKGWTTSVLFRDVQNLWLGQEWKPTLEEALKSSALLMPICSPSFLNSDYCGKEFAAFLNRLGRAPNPPAGGHGAIFPVIWVRRAKGCRPRLSTFNSTMRGSRVTTPRSACGRCFTLLATAARSSSSCPCSPSKWLTLWKTQCARRTRCSALMILLFPSRTRRRTVPSRRPISGSTRRGRHRRG
ncbi:TIR domain-containing protein [Bradyrhizobium sp. CSA207]|nr:TIR domain-containing protein [Bradyrhizobium sp. CSA207]